MHVCFHLLVMLILEEGQLYLSTITDDSQWKHLHTFVVFLQSNGCK